MAKATQVRLYHENIVEHYENPRNVGSFDKNDNNVGTVRPLVFIQKLKRRESFQSLPNVTKEKSL